MKKFIRSISFKRVYVLLLMLVGYLALFLSEVSVYASPFYGLFEPEKPDFID